MNWKQLETFYLVATAKGLSEASKGMNLSQGAISRQITLLERDFNVKLFLRHSNGMNLTQSGEMVYRHVRTMYAEASKVLLQINDTKEHPSGILKVSAPVSLGSFWLIPLITKFNALYPDISIELNLTDKEVDLSMGDNHIAIRYPVVEDPNLVRKRLKTIGFYPFAATSYLLASGSPERPEDLDDHRLISYKRNSEEDHKNYNWILNPGKNIERDWVLQIDNLYACYLAIRSGLGIGIIPEYYGWNTETIIKILPDYKAIYERELSLYYPVELRGLSRINVFHDFIYEELDLL